jgi:Domain of unknown function (DUF4832)/Domain of unknown function (DUF4874)/Secretion system C-terminal sorting domain
MILKKALMKKLIQSLLVFCLCNFANAQTATINYSASSAIISNPERGFCEYSILTVPATGNFTTLTASSFTALVTKKQTTILRLYYLPNFLSTATLPANFLTRLQTDFTTIRNAGFKVILRFAYKEYSGTFPPPKPYNDAPPKALLLSHINQLKPTILANSDVILTFESGFWGLYGENYYTDHYGDISTEPITAAHIADRKEIIDAMFTCIGPSRKLAVRTPPIKAAYFNQVIPADTLTIAEAYNGTDKSRIGGFNDCFLAEFNDYTYVDTTTEKPFWAAESKYTIMGGETCIDNALYTNCTNAQKDMRRFNWTFCNDLYQAAVITRWKSTTPGPECFTAISNNLGYRLVLQTATISSGSALNVVNYSITLKNEGYAAPVNPRKVELVFRSTTTSENFVRRVNADPRLWFGGSTITLSGTINTPVVLTAGNYDVLLKLSDPEPTLASNIKYNIQFANSGSLWETATGFNKLNHTVNLVSGNGILPIKIISFSGQMINGNAKIDWKVNNDISAKEFETEYSTDGINFTKIDHQNFILNTQDYTTYHQTNFKDVLFYRLKVLHNDGTILYSNIIRLNGNRDDRIILKTNLCKNDIELSSNYNDIGDISIYSLEGRLVYKGKINNQTININCYNWARGTYILYSQNNKVTETKKIILF